MKKTQVTAIMALALSCILSISCGSSVTADSVVAVFIAGDVKVSTAGGEYRPLKVRDMLKKGDTVKTGEKSFVSLQVGSEAIVQVTAGSTVNMVSLLEGSTSELALSSGKVLCKVEKLVKGGQFKVKTPTMNAAVRGTVFSVSASEKSSSVALKQGKLIITMLTDGKEQTLEEGKSADIAESIVERDITSSEKIELKKVELFTIEQKAGTLSVEELEGKAEKLAPEIEKIDKELEESGPMTLEKLREKFGRVDVVTLYNGKVYRGAILSRGASWRMVTPQGQVFIPGSQVKNTGSQ